MNVVLLTIDALRADHVSLYGYERTTTPHLDRFGEEGTWFTNAVSISSHTREAIAPLLSGCYPPNAVTETYRFCAESIVEQVSTTDIRTAAFHSNPYLSRPYGYARGFDTFYDSVPLPSNRLSALLHRTWEKIRNRHYTRATEINDRALSWLDSEGEEPFFLWNHYMDVHGPYDPPEASSGFGTNLPEGRSAQRLYLQAKNRSSTISPAERQILIDLYDSEIRYVDNQIGKFLDSLRNRGLLEKTVVIITADHGEGLGEKGYFGHPRHLHDGLVRVPLLVRFPDQSVPPVETPVSTIDVAPTILTVFDQDASMLPGTPLQHHSHSQDKLTNRCVMSLVSPEEGSDHWRIAGRMRSGKAFGTMKITEADASHRFTPSGDPAVCRRLTRFVRTHSFDMKSQSTEENEVASTNPVVARRLTILGYQDE